jgi:hypothetical protein
MSMQFTMFKHPRNCDVHFMTNAHWKDTSFFNIIMRTLTKHTWLWGKLRSLPGKCLPHPPYSPDLAPSDYQGYTKITRNRHYRNTAGQQTLRTWLQNSEMDFYCSGIFKHMQHWQQCLVCSWDFVE